MENKQYKTSPRFLISGGGTGGHIFPAIAIADELKRRIPNAEFIFVGSSDKMEMEKVPQAGYKIEGLWISGIQRDSLLANFKLPFKVIYSLYKSYKIIKKFKPTAAIATGGFASGPALWMADKLGIPTFIQEQNSFPGITNKINKNHAKKIFVAYSGMQKFFPSEKIILTGNPVRKSLFEKQLSSSEAKKSLGFDSDKLLILSVGGSLGARAINNFWKETAEKITKNNDIQLYWQTGKLDYPSIVSQKIGENESRILIKEFVNDMSTAYAAADIIVSRSGAIAISELCLAGKPTVFVPLPTAAEDHQTKNALALVEKNAALMVENKEIKTHLEETIESLIQNGDLRKT